MAESMSMVPFIWIGVLIFMLILEGLTNQLVSIWFVVGALAASIVSFFVKEVTIQLYVFVGVSLILLAATRPIVRKIKSTAEVVPTNADRYIGKTAVVLEDVDSIKGTGQVKVGNSVWSAKPREAGTIAKDTVVNVVDIVGVKLVVEPKS